MQRQLFAIFTDLRTLADETFFQTWQLLNYMHTHVYIHNTLIIIWINNTVIGWE